MVGFLGQAMQEAISMGFTGFRVTVDLSWCATDTDSYSQMSEYEAALDRYFPGKPSLGICMYDMKLFTEEQSDAVMRKAHRLAIINPSDNNRAVRVRKRGFFGDVIFDATERTTLFHYVIQKDNSSDLLMAGQDSTLSGAMRAVGAAVKSWATA
jgi:DcmR-like sensory protein